MPTVGVSKKPMPIVGVSQKTINVTPKQPPIVYPAQAQRIAMLKLMNK